MMQWFQDNLDWFGHMIEAVGITIVVALIARLFVLPNRICVLIGAAFAVGHFHGREKRDYEVSVHMPPPHLDAYLMWRWSWDQATDFWPVAAMFILFLLLMRKRFIDPPGP